MTAIEKLQTQGIRRLGTPKRGFHYVYANGKRVTDAVAKRIQKLRLPPAWTHVAINPSATGRLQAIGKDAAGRWQYRYHESHRREQDAKKYRRLIHFAEAIPRMRARIEHDVRLPGMPREKVMACILRILSTCFIRAGSQVYASENGSYGIATLRRKHVQVKGSTVTFDFPGKSGKQQHRELRDPIVARIVKQLLPVGGPEVFKWKDEATGEYIDVRRRHINEYIKEVMGERFSAKDFRTWAGTLICACALARAGVEADEGVRAHKRKIVEAVKETAAVLGNTPAICKASYIYPGVFASYDRGQVVEKYFGSVEELVAHRAHGLHASERALMELLKREAKQEDRTKNPIELMKRELARRKRAQRRSTQHKRAA